MIKFVKYHGINQLYRWYLQTIDSGVALSVVIQTINSVYIWLIIMEAVLFWNFVAMNVLININMYSKNVSVKNNQK